MRKLALILAIICEIFPAGKAPCADSSPTNAPASASTNTPAVLPPVTVFGTNNAGSLTSPSAAVSAEQYRQIPGGFTVKTADDMQKGRKSNFQDLLQGVPGVFMQSENGTEISKISIRGSGIESDDEPLGVEFLLDGISFNQGDGEAIIEDFDVKTIQYAEIYRGADAFKYGALTMGGAINLVPFTGYDASPFQAQAEAASYGFLSGQVSSGGVEGPFDYYASLSGRYRDGYRDHSRENTELLFSDLGYKLSDHLENRLYVTLDQTDRQLPSGLTKEQMIEDPQQADPDAITQDFNKQWEYIRVADKLSYVNNNVELDVGGYWWFRSLEERGFFDPNDFEQGIQKYGANDAGVNVNYTTRNDIFGHQNVLDGGLSPAVETEADHNYENLDGQMGATIAQDLELSVNVPIYAQDQFYLSDKLSAVAGIQAVYALRHFYDYFTDTLDGDQSHENSFFGLSPKIGLLYEFDEHAQAFVNYSATWQPPSFDNMVTFDTGPDVSLVYTPLVPQRAWTIEVGTRGERGPAQWDLALYHAWVKNELLDLYDANDVDRGDVNVPRTYHQGIEAGLGLELWNSVQTLSPAGQRITFDQTYTLTDLHFDHDPVYGNNRIGGVPIHVYEAQLMYECPCGFYAGPNVQCNLSSYPVDQQNTLNADAYALLGFKIGYRRPSGFSVFFQAMNLTDERYATSVDPIPNAQVPADPQVFHPGDGRSFYGGVSWSL
jgi:iron complex outermembrane recepter protein